MTSRMVGSVLTLVILLSSVVGGAAQTYTQMQWGMNKGVTPYAFGANINGAWSDLGTVSSTGVWTLSPTYFKIKNINFYSQLVSNNNGTIYASKILDAAAFGAVGDITTDNATVFAAISAAVASELASGSQDGVEVRFPCGRYRSTSTLSITLPNARHVTITGGGNACTTLYFQNADGIDVTFGNQYSSATVRDMSLVTNDTSDTYTAINFHRSESVIAWSQHSSIRNVTIQPFDNFSSTSAWKHGIILDKVSYTSIDGYQFVGKSSGGLKGVGLKVIGDAANSAISVITNVSNTSIDVCDKGIVYDTYFQGLALNTTNITNCDYGIYQPSTASFVLQIAVTNSQLNNLTSSIELLSKSLSVNLTNNLFITRAGAYAIRTLGLVNSTIASNTFTAQDALHQGTSVEVGTSGDPAESVVIADNAFNAVDKAIVLKAGAIANVHGNIYTNVATPYTNNSSNSYQWMNMLNGALYSWDQVPIQSTSSQALVVGSNLSSAIALQVSGATNSVGVGVAPTTKFHVANTVDGAIARFARVGGTNLPILDIGVDEAGNYTSLTSTGASNPPLRFYVGATLMESLSMTGAIFNSGITSAGTKPIATGAGGTCAAGTVTGGALVGTVALTGNCVSTNTLALTGMPAATTGYVCDATDRTAKAVTLVETTTTTTSATFEFTASSNSGNIIQFKCLGY